MTLHSGGVSQEKFYGLPTGSLLEVIAEHLNCNEPANHYYYAN